MTTVNIEDFQRDISHLLDQAAAGKSLIITRAGIPVLKLEAVATERTAETAKSEPVDVSKRLGFLVGQGTIPDDFNNWMQDEIADMFEGRPGKFADIEAYMRDQKKKSA